VLYARQLVQERLRNVTIDRHGINTTPAFTCMRRYKVLAWELAAG